MSGRARRAISWRRCHWKKPERRSISGCGPGNSTELIIDRYGKDGVSGLDSDLNMLEAARKRLPDTTFDRGLTCAHLAAE